MQALRYGMRARRYAASFRRDAMPAPASAQCRQAARAASHPGSSHTWLILKTGVTTSVSLFVLAIIIHNLLAPVLLIIVGLVVLINLLLTGLTGLERLESSVGQNIDMAAAHAQGV
jgi:hypothetical protein